MIIELKMLAINDGPKNYARLSYIGEFVEVRNLDMEGCKIDIRIDDTQVNDTYVGTIVRIHGQVQGLAVGDEVKFPMHCTIRCFDAERNWL